MAVALHDYQESGIEFLLSRRSAGLFDEMGTGKTRQVSEAVRRLGTKSNLTVAPKIVARHWTRELSKVYGPTCTLQNPQQMFKDDCALGAFIFLGTQEQKAIALQQLKLFKTLRPDLPSFLITNYQGQHDLIKYQRNWETRVLDESHAIKNHESKTFHTTRRILTLHDYLLTGTPTSRGPRDLWAYLNIIDPNKHHGFWPWVTEFVWVERTEAQGTWFGGPRNSKALRDYMQQYVIRRLKKNVLPNLTKTRQVYEVDPYPEQRRLYDKLTDEQFAIDEKDNLLLIDNGAVRTLRHRQLLVAPGIIGFPKMKSATIEATVEIATTCGTPSVVFTAFAEAFPYIKAAFPKDWEIYIIRGGMDYEKLDDIVQAFERSRTNNRTLIATTGISAGYEILTAGHAIFAGLDWSNVLNLQSEDRLPRPGNPYHINCHYIVNNDTVEVDVVETVSDKVAWDFQSIRPSSV